MPPLEVVGKTLGFETPSPASLLDMTVLPTPTRPPVFTSLSQQTVSYNQMYIFGRDCSSCIV